MKAWKGAFPLTHISRHLAIYIIYWSEPSSYNGKQQPAWYSVAIDLSKFTTLP